MSEPSPAPPHRVQLSSDTWAVILSLALALLVKLHVIGRIPW